MAIAVNFVWGKLPSDFCWQDSQQYMDAILALLTGTIAGSFSGVIKGTTTPAVSDQDKLWVKTDASGKPIGNFVFVGQWIWPNPRGPNGGEGLMWLDSEASLWSYDGGDGTDPSVVAPTPTTGSMWRVGHGFDDRMPIGWKSGGIAGSAGATGGEQTHTLVQAELPNVTLGLQATAPAGNHYSAVTGTGGNIAAYGLGINVDSAGKPQVLTDPLGSGTAHNNMPPYYGVLFARRTSRVYYVG